jgi:hypothetical protein
VRHSHGGYAVRALGKPIHTNTAESFFALLKRGYYGAYHQLSKSATSGRYRLHDEQTMGDNRKQSGPIKLPLKTKDGLRALLAVKPTPKQEKVKPEKKGDA